MDDAGQERNQLGRLDWLLDNHNLREPAVIQFLHIVLFLLITLACVFVSTYCYITNPVFNVNWNRISLQPIALDIHYAGQTKQMRHAFGALTDGHRCVWMVASVKENFT